MQIRRMMADDYPMVYGIWTACEGMELNDVDDSPEGIARFLDRNPETCFVAEADGALIGAILAGCDGRRGYIYHAAVAPEARGKGVGMQLVEAALEQLKAMGITKVGLLTFADNEEGNFFWLKRGFEPRMDLTYHSAIINPIHH